MKEEFVRVLALLDQIRADVEDVRKACRNPEVSNSDKEWMEMAMLRAAVRLRRGIDLLDREAPTGANEH